MNNHFIITARENIVSTNCVYRTNTPSSLYFLIFFSVKSNSSIRYGNLEEEKNEGGDLVPCCNWSTFRNTNHVKRCNLTHTHSTYTPEWNIVSFASSINFIMAVALVRNRLNTMKSNLFLARELALICCVRRDFCIYFFLIEILRLCDCCCCCRLCCSMTKTIMLSVNSLRLVALCGVKSVKFINIHSRRSTL